MFIEKLNQSKDKRKPIIEQDNNASGKIFYISRRKRKRNWQNKENQNKYWWSPISENKSNHNYAKIRREILDIFETRYDKIEQRFIFTLFPF